MSHERDLRGSALGDDLADRVETEKPDKDSLTLAQLLRKSPPGWRPDQDGEPAQDGEDWAGSR
jgi:hypothetical protein